MARNPYFRFFPSDWRAGTDRLSLTERAIYFEVLCLIYESGDPVSEDYRRLARAFGTTPITVKRAIDSLVELNKLTRNESGGLWNERAGAELEWQKNRGHLASSAGKKSARIRAEKLNGINKPASTNVQQQFSIPESRTRLFKDSSDDESFVNGHAVDVPRSDPQPVQKAFDNYNRMATFLGLPVATKLTEDRKKKIRARLKEHGIEGWNTALKNLQHSDFLCGKTDHHFRADLEFMLRPARLNKLVEGGYASDER